MVDGSSETGTIHNNSIEFPNVLPNIKMVLSMLRLGIKERIILENASALRTISTTMQTNLAPEAQANGSILLRSEGTTVFTIAIPEAKDANGINFPVSINLRLAGENYSLELSVTADSGGITPRFPLEIDPTITLKDPGKINDAIYNKSINVSILLQNYPNPFNSSTSIKFTLPKSGVASLIIFNVLGQPVRSFFNIFYISGEHSIIWDGKDNYGSVCSSGIYFCELRFGSISRTNKLLFLR